MGQIRKSIKAEFIEFQCGECNKGVYRVHSENKGTTPRQWRHLCSHCLHEAYFTAVYPVIEYKEKYFMLADHLKVADLEPPSIWVGRDSIPPKPKLE